MTQAEMEILQKLMQPTTTQEMSVQTAISKNTSAVAETSSTADTATASGTKESAMASSTVEPHNNLPAQPQLPPEVANAYKDLYEQTLNELNSIKATVAELKTANAKLAITATHGDPTIGNKSAEQILADMFIDDVKSKKNVF